MTFEVRKIKANVSNEKKLITHKHVEKSLTSVAVRHKSCNNIFFVHMSFTNGKSGC